jgi:carbon monoxide dehydrogenase subunit G
VATVERSATIDASPDEVWKVLADFAAISGWAPNVDHSCLLSEQTEGVGTVRRIQTAGMTVVETVETWTIGEAVGYRITGLPPVIKSVTNTWRLTASGDATAVVLTTEIDAGQRPPQKAIAKVVGRKLAAASDEMIAGLTTRLEQGDSA